MNALLPNPMRRTDYAAYRQALGERICRYCADGDGRGGCKRGPAERCSVSSHVDLVVEAVLSVGDSPDVGPYLAALRSRVCPRCRQDAAGDCAMRDSGDCRLDAYLLPVIEVIEDVARRRGDGAFRG